jgi:triacylglycerol lipase
MSGKDWAGPQGTRGLVAPELLAGVDAMPNYDLTEEILPAMRSGAAGRPAPQLSPAQQAIQFEERRVPGPAGAPDVRVLIYTPPKSAQPRPAFLHMHGGGFVMGAPELYDGKNRAMAAELGCVVVSVNYRLAPETRFPGAVQDCYAALLWLYREAKALGVDAARIAIGGESAGGGHAVALALYARERGEVPICLQVLDSPMIDDRSGGNAHAHPYCGEFVWPPAKNRFGWRALLGMEPGGADVPAAAVPARAKDFAGLPPAFITVGALDLFLEEDMEYARRLIRAGVSTELHVIPGAYHGFGAVAPDSPQMQGVIRLQREALARAFARSGK